MYPVVKDELGGSGCRSPHGTVRRGAGHGTIGNRGTVGRCAWDPIEIYNRAGQMDNRYRLLKRAADSDRARYRSPSGVPVHPSTFERES